MSSAGSSPAGRGWLDPGKGFLEDVPPRKRQLALALRALARLLKTQDLDKPADSYLTQADAAKRLGCKADSLSRYLNRPRVPTRNFVELLHKEASADAAISGQDVCIALDDLLALHASAEGEQLGCKLCVELGGRIDSLTQQLSTPCPACAVRQQAQDERAAELAALRGDVAALRAAVQEMETVEAGLQARLAMAKASRTPLPVPRQQRDRQRSEKEVAVARQLTTQAKDLDGAGKPDSALTLLRQSTTELLTPVETALVLLELRQEERDHLADDLIHVYGRDQKNLRHAMAVSVALNEEGAFDDAGAILRAVLKRSAGAT
ncbi:hypothetical protein ABZ642_29055 [Streptomyces sp. NPDC007157]|uniref:helix-turn-helix domain-containing protein n=1 Tax=Streptomyces sp. NPDC007157 TaxID=3154681 RepID=UPI00340DFF02